MLTFRITVISGSPDFVVAIVLVTSGANIVNVTVVASMGTGTDTLSGIGRSRPSLFTGPAESLSVWQVRGGVSEYDCAIFGVTSIHALVWYFIVGAIEMIIGWVFTITSTALNFVVTCVNISPSALIDSDLLAFLLVCSQVVVFFTVLA